jgi:hypothetical protein
MVDIRDILKREKAKHGAPQEHAMASDIWIIMNALEKMLDRWWQPIESAPQDGSPVDLWVPSTTGGHRRADCRWMMPQDGGFRRKGPQWCWYHDERAEWVELGEEPSHWMRTNPPFIVLG